MKNSINWFVIPTLIFERAHNFYNIIFDTHFEVIIDANWDDMAVIWNMDKNTASWCITSNMNQKISQDWVFIYLDAHGNIDDILNRVIPAGWKIKKPKTNIWEYWFIAHIEDSEWNILWLHEYKK
jgi:predicted enzyme related to lactoylglutathione lyase